MTKNVFETLTASTVTNKSYFVSKDNLSERKSLRQSVNDFTINETLRVSIDKKMQKRASAQCIKGLQYEDKQDHSVHSERFLSSNYKLKQISHSQRKKSSVAAVKPEEGTERRDFYGNLILKGKNKKQRISFLDDVLYKNNKNCKFVEIIDIQSYKKYNEDTSGDITKKKKNGKCACIIF